VVAVAQHNLEALLGLPPNGTPSIKVLVDEVICDKVRYLNSRLRLAEAVNDWRRYSSLPVISGLSSQVGEYGSTDALSAYVATLLEVEPD